MTNVFRVHTDKLVDLCLETSDRMAGKDISKVRCYYARRNIVENNRFNQSGRKKIKHDKTGKKFDKSNYVTVMAKFNRELYQQCLNFLDYGSEIVYFRKRCDVDSRYYFTLSTIFFPEELIVRLGDVDKVKRLVNKYKLINPDNAYQFHDIFVYEYEEGEEYPSN